MSRASAAKPADRRRTTILYATLAVIVIAVVVGIALASRQVVPKAASEAPMQSKLKAGDKAPEFAVQTNAGPFDLAQVSTPVLLEVFATWCPHCQRETQVLNSLAAAYAGKVAIVAVSGSPQGIDGTTPESQADVNAFGARFAVRYPLAFDPDLKVAQDYLQGGYPTLVLIKPDKTIAWVTSGEIPQADVAKQLDAVLR